MSNGDQEWILDFLNRGGKRGKKVFSRGSKLLKISKSLYFRGKFARFEILEGRNEGRSSQ